MRVFYGCTMYIYTRKNKIEGTPILKVAMVKRLYVVKISEDCLKPRETICNVVSLKKIYIILIIYRLKSQKNSSKNVSTKYLLSSKEVGLFFPRQKVSLFAK